MFRNYCQSIIKNNVKVDAVQHRREIVGTKDFRKICYCAI